MRALSIVASGLFALSSIPAFAQTTKILETAIKVGPTIVKSCGERGGCQRAYEKAREAIPKVAPYANWAAGQFKYETTPAYFDRNGRAVYSNGPTINLPTSRSPARRR